MNLKKWLKLLWHHCPKQVQHLLPAKAGSASASSQSRFSICFQPPVKVGKKDPQMQAAQFKSAKRI
jgi:hypothetical protein